MCQICHRQFCPPSCPEYEGYSAARGRAEHQCDLCQGSIYKGEPHFSDGEQRICLDCVRYADIEDVCRVCHIKSNGELFNRLGFELTRDGLDQKEEYGKR